MRFVGVLMVCVLGTAGALAEDFKALREEYLAKYKPLWLESSQAWWEANISGSDAAFERKKKAEQALDELHHDKAMFEKLKKLHDDGSVKDPIEARELDVMYRSYLAGQADPQLQKRVVELQNEVEQIFNTHRSLVDGKQATENDVRAVLKDSTDSAACEAAWKGYMAVGGKVHDKLRELVTLRNQIARQLGFRDFYAMRLALDEVDENELFRLLDELQQQSAAAFGAMKQELDKQRAERFKIDANALRPWHFGDLFFQEAPGGQEVNLDDLYKDVDLLALTREYYAGVGLPCEDIIARSDLYEKPGKSPHAFCSDLDREGDIRVLCNVKPNLYWADTMLHEIGHGVYDKYIRRDVPWLLREAAHGITTEGMAQMFGAMTTNGDFLRRVLKLDESKAGPVAKAARENQRREKLIFGQWAQVMVRFEQGMYASPDQDLGKLWWDLKKQYQMLNPPETTDRPDYAAKVHVLTSPVYYHNYLLGELFAAQVKHKLVTDVLGGKDVRATCLFGEPKAGEFLKKNVFGPGNLRAWYDLTRDATGEPLATRYFVAEFVR